MLSLGILAAAALASQSSPPRTEMSWANANGVLWAALDITYHKRHCEPRGFTWDTDRLQEDYAAAVNVLGSQADDIVVATQRRYATHPTRRVPIMLPVTPTIVPTAAEWQALDRWCATIAPAYLTGP
jgi:hypothetical protein